VSTDLVEWTELPTALVATPTEHVWSGSVVHDAANTSGLGAAGAGPLVALWTRYEPGTGRQSQCLSHSVDRGRTWQPHPGNPVLDIGSTSFRDPKVLRHDDGWLMVVVLADDRTVELYRSPDLLAWERWSGFGPAGSVEGVWECPDLVQVPVEGSRRTAWVLLVSVSDGAPAGGSGMQYFVGDLGDDGFTATQPARWVDHGADFYAAISYADAPQPTVQAWMSNWQYADRVPATEFRGSMTLARRLALRPRDGELRLVQRPVVRASAVAYELVERPLVGTLELPVAARSFRVVAEVDPGAAGAFALHLRVGPDERTTVRVDVAARTVTLDRRRSGTVEVHPSFAAAHTAALPDGDGPVRLEVVVDVASVEVFAADGEVVLTDQVFPSPSSTGMAVHAEDGEAHVRRLAVLV
jgi:sucrose-6-phosphate hydrolase SacC (GH32 family)